MFRAGFFLCAVASCVGFTSAASSLTTVLPASYSISNEPSPKLTTSYSGNEIALTSSNPLVILDYGREVVGTPILSISSLPESVSIELRYSEEFAGLNNRFADGPFTFSNGLSNTFRTETFDVTETGALRSYFLQGGQRWQSIRLLTNGTIGFSLIGLETDMPILDSDKLPGSFKSSNELYEDIWDLGARAVQLSCIENGTLRPTWDITEDGALIYGQQTAQSVQGLKFSNYTLSFSTKIVRGGVGWRVATPVFSYGPLFVLTTNYTSDSTFLKTIPDLLPPNTLVVGYGWSLQNVTSLPTGPINSYPLSVSINEDEWYEITTSIAPEGFIIAVNNITIATISYAEGIAFPDSRFGPSTVTTGSWGFGPYQDQVAYVKDVLVTSSNGSTIYENDMKSSDILLEYGIATNDGSVCLDGPKRDRLVWIGDFVHTARIIGASTNRSDFITGTLDYEFKRQITSGPGAGYVPTDGAMGISAANKVSYYPAYYPIRGYQIFFLVIIGDHYQMSGDLVVAQKYWEQTKLLASAMLALINPISGLMATQTSIFFVGPNNGTAASALMVLALRRLIPIALAVGDQTTATFYTASADKLAENINTQLWNDERGFYSLSTTLRSDQTAAGTAFTILAGIANKTQASRSIANLPALKYGTGYISDSTVVLNNETQLSPNIFGFVLEALFIANTTMGIQTLDVAKDLLDNFWSKMVTQNEYYTGASWEYLHPDGSPGMGLFTSLAHPWGGAPTFVLPQYVLGISALEPGYKKWQFQPLVYGMDLDHAEGVYPTPQGEIKASWRFSGGKLKLRVNGPVGTTGVVKLPFLPSSLSVSGRQVQASSTNIEVSGGERVDIIACL